MARHEPREIVRVDAARQIVPGGNRAERAGVIVEAGGLVDPSGLRGALAEAPHAFDRVVEPPGRPEAQGRIVAGERRQLPRSEERRVGKEGRSRWSPYH